jgi:hypothetical protein
MAPDKTTMSNAFRRCSRTGADVTRQAPSAPVRERRRNVWLFVCGFLLTAVGAASADDSDEPPVANQPPNFNGAVGDFTKFTTHADPTTLPVGDPLTFIVHIAGSAQRPVPRPPLRRLPEFTQRFVIEDLRGPESKAGQGVWEFRYRLKPKPLNPPVSAIPALRFDYFKPKVLPREKGYRTKYAEAIPLTVLPRPEVQPADIQGAAEPAALPEELYELVEGPDAVLRREEPFALPGPIVLILVFLGMPALCVAWYALWRYCDPDAARLTQHRQSRAARKALQALETTGHRTSPAQSERVATVLTDYLQHRWDLTAAEPTPQEVVAHLEHLGCSEPCVRQAAEFYQACDIARFAPEPALSPDGLTATAVRLIRTLEDQP